MRQTLEIYTRKDFGVRLNKILEIAAISRGRILANLAGAYHDPKCKGKLIWSGPTILKLKDTVVRLDLNELDEGCLLDKVGVHCSKHFRRETSYDSEIYKKSQQDKNAKRSSEDFVESVEENSIHIGMDKIFEKAEIEFVESLEEIVRLGISISKNKINFENNQNPTKRSFLEEIVNNGKYSSGHHHQHEENSPIYKHLVKIEQRLICALTIFENMFSLIETSISKYLKEEYPHFKMDDYDPYQVDSQQPDLNYPYNNWDGKRNSIPTTTTIGKTPENVGEKKRSNYEQSGIDCSKRGILPIWKNIKDCSIEFLGEEFLLRMLYETSRLPSSTGCLDDCSKKRSAEQDYDLNDFVAKFNFYHIYLSCSSEYPKKLMWAISELIPEAKGSEHLSELRLSLDYLSDNFDGELCNKYNYKHENQNARDQFVGGKKCKGGEISGGNWNEYSLFTLFNFKIKYQDHENTDYSSPFYFSSPSNHSHSHPQHDWERIKSLKISVDQKGSDVLNDINFAPVSWKHCLDRGKNCSSEQKANCGEKCEKKNSVRGGKRKFVDTGVDEMFVDSDNYLFNTLNRNRQSKIKKYFTSFISTHGECGVGTDLVTPMYFLRNYESLEKGCCDSNNCRDLLLIDFFDSLEEPKETFLRSPKPTTLITRASEKWKYPAEGKPFFIPTDQSSNLIEGGVSTTCSKVGRPSTISTMKFCHFKSKDSIRRRCSKTKGCEEKKWILSDYQCGCDFDCQSESAPEWAYTQSGLNLTNNGVPIEWESKCIQPLGYCVRNMEENVTLHAQDTDPNFSVVLRGCDYYDECSASLGSDYHCDTTFLDDAGVGFSFCAKTDSSNVTNIPCSLSRLARQCTDSICTAGMSGCYSDFEEHINHCKELFLSSEGKLKCQFNLMKLDISSNIQDTITADDLLVGSGSGSGDYGYNTEMTGNNLNNIDSFKNCFYARS